MKRKLEEVLENDRSRIVTLSAEEAHRDLVVEVRTQVEILEASFSSAEQDRASSKRAIHVLSELAKNGNFKYSNRVVFSWIELSVNMLRGFGTDF